jgi:resuscitation-promoting factor RpfA
VHRSEGSWTANTGNGFYGGFQFALGTWTSQIVGGTVRPDLTTPREQLYRAWRLWRVMGWSPWPNTARACGLR